jgi:carboxylesterase type B
MIYPPVRGDQSFWWWAAAASLSDVGWGLGHCAARRVARMLVAGGSPDVYAYEFQHPAQGDATDGTYGWSLADAGFSVPGNTVCPHGSEVAFTFGAVHAVPAGEAAELAARMGRLWTNFALSGNPGAVWPSYARSNDTFLLLDVSSAGGVRPQQSVEREQCAFFDALLEQDIGMVLQGQNPVISAFPGAELTTK